jgi:prolyl-tRNA editing enzyme YbaK/EbsC (Cys-tRNA(Pro) deacylase)
MLRMSTTPSALTPSAQKVQDALAAQGFALQVVELPNTTRSAAEAAQAIGCTVAQIAKSLIFKTRHTQRAVLVIASGVNRVDEKAIAAQVGEPIDRPDADFVRQQTGFAIGGVPPVAHAQPLQTYIDVDLLQFTEIWAAAGTPFAVFKLTPADLLRMTSGQVLGLALKRAQ